MPLVSSNMSRINVLEKPFPNGIIYLCLFYSLLGRIEVSTSAFGLLFSEIVQYSIQRVSNGNELETRLSELGVRVGIRALEMITHREKANKKEIKLVSMLQFLTTTVWKSLFGKVADGLEKNEKVDGQYYIWENSPITNKWISVPKDMGELNCAAFNGGIIKGILDSALFV